MNLAVTLLNPSILNADDLKLNFENEEFAKNVEIELLDHDNRHVDIQKEVKGKSVIIKDVEYNPVKFSLK